MQNGPWSNALFESEHTAEMVRHTSQSESKFVLKKCSVIHIQQSNNLCRGGGEGGIILQRVREDNYSKKLT